MMTDERIAELDNWLKIYTCHCNHCRRFVESLHKLLDETQRLRPKPTLQWTEHNPWTWTAGEFAIIITKPPNGVMLRYKHGLYAFHDSIADAQAAAEKLRANDS